MTPELQQRIEQEAKKYNSSRYASDIRRHFIAGATLYATRVEELERENKELKERNEKMREALESVVVDLRMLNDIYPKLIAVKTALNTITEALQWKGVNKEYDTR